MLTALHKLAFGTNAFSGPMNPTILSGASVQAPPKRVSLQSVTQKTAELWPGFFAEMMKEAGPDVNVGQWWEQVGGPFLAKGGDHKQFKKMMQSAGLPANMQAKFEQVAKAKYTNATQRASAPPSSGAWSGGYEPPNPGYQRSGSSRSGGGGRRPWDDWDPGEDFRKKWEERSKKWDDDFRSRHEERQARQAAEDVRVKKDWVNPASIAGAGALAGTTAYGALADQKEDPHTQTHAWKGRLGSLMRGMGGGATLGYIAGASTEARGAGLLGAGLGALAGLPVGELMHRANEDTRGDAARAMRQPSKGKALTQRASMTTAAHMNAASPEILATSLGSGILGGMSRQNAGIPLLAGAARHIGIGLSKKRHEGKAFQEFEGMRGRAAAREVPDDGALAKAAAGAPTRGNFMMASDIPAFKAPRLDRPIQKEGDMSTEDVRAYAPKLSKEKDAEGSYMPYGAGDFKRSKYAMADLGAFVAELLEKKADVSPAVTWNGAQSNSQHQPSIIPPFRAPRLDRAIQKEGMMTPAGQLNKTQHVGAPKASAPPGPSIADIAKPKGPKFGIGIPGAFKGKI